MFAGLKFAVIFRSKLLTVESTIWTAVRKIQLWSWSRRMTLLNISFFNAVGLVRPKSSQLTIPFRDDGIEF